MVGPNPAALSWDHRLTTSRDGFPWDFQECIVAEKFRQHPHLVNLLDAFVSRQGGPCIVMRWAGVNLKTAIMQLKGLTPHHIRQASLHTLRGLEAIHAAGIVHTDIHPENILVETTRTGWHCTVADLGSVVAALETEQAFAVCMVGRLPSFPPGVAVVKRTFSLWWCGAVGLGIVSGGVFCGRRCVVWGRKGCGEGGA